MCVQMHFYSLAGCWYLDLVQCLTSAALTTGPGLTQNSMKVTSLTGHPSSDVTVTSTTREFVLSSESRFIHRNLEIKNKHNKTMVIQVTYLKKLSIVELVHSSTLVYTHYTYMFLKDVNEQSDAHTMKIQ